MVVPFTMGVGGNETVTVEEPSRTSFPDNLNGAVQFSIAHSVYKIVEVMGGSLGSFVAGFGVQFLERIEPSLVSYARPLIDLVLEQTDLDPHIRQFFSQLRAPTAEGATAILGGLAQQAGGAVMGSVLNTAMSPVTKALNMLMRPTLPNLSTLIDMYRRLGMDREWLDWYLGALGYEKQFTDKFLETSLRRAAPADWLENLKRGHVGEGEVAAELRRQGVSPNSINLFLQNIEPLLDTDTMIKAVHRRLWDQTDVVDILRRWRYSDTNIATLLELAHPIPGPSDLVTMAVREAWRDDVAARWHYDEDRPSRFDEYMGSHGFEPEWAKWYWRAHWALPSVTQGFEMLHRLPGFEPDLDVLLRVLDIPSYWREKLKAISYAPYTRVDVRRMYGLGVLGREDVKRSYLDLGYDDEHAENMTEFTVRYEDSTGEDKSAEYRELTRTVICEAYRKGILDEGEATTRLLSLDYTQEDIDLLLSLTRWEKEVGETPDYEAEYRKDVRNIIEKGYARRLISATEATQALVALNYGEAESGYILASIDFWYGYEQLNAQLKAIGDAYVSRGLNRQDVAQRLGSLGVPSEMSSQVLETWDIERETRSRRLTEAQYRKAVKEMIIGIPEYQENLRGLGYTEYDIWVLTGIMVGKDEVGPAPQSGPIPLGDRMIT